MLILTAWEEDERMILKTDLLDISIQADYLSRDPPQETPEAARDRLVRTLSRPRQRANLWDSLSENQYT